MALSIFDILREAEGDEQQDAGGNAPADPNAPAEAPAEGGEDQAGGEDEDNFDIDANLDDPDEGGEGGDEDAPAADGGDDFGDTGGGGGAEEPEDEPNEDNTDIFASLTAEEQQMKIMELKNQFNSLYVSCDDLLEKLNAISVDEDSNDFINRMSTSLFDLRTYIADYLIYSFSQKSFVENDIMFNRFLAIINSMSIALGKFQNRVEAERGENERSKQDDK
jgi:hypothetical protein